MTVYAMVKVLLVLIVLGGFLYAWALCSIARRADADKERLRVSQVRRGSAPHVDQQTAANCGQVPGL
jgi:hypothetical protein